MKKLVALLLVIVMLLFAACGPAQSPIDEPTTSTTTATEPSSTDVLSDPSEPSGAEPSDPSEDTTQPSEDIPTEPSDPTAEPSEPTEPTEPSEPSEPTQPSEPSTDSGNSSTGGTDDEKKPSQPTEPSEPDDEIVMPPEDYTLKVSASTMTLEVGKTGTLTSTYTGTGTLTWSSNKTTVATVSNGKVTAKAAGTAVITLSDGKKQAQCVVTVKDYTLSISHSTLKLTVGDVGNLTATYTGTGTLTWSSGKTSVATVSNGKVTAKTAGTATITVTDGVKYATCTVTVEKKPVTDYTLKVSASTMTLEVGKTGTLTSTYTGTGTLTWSSNKTTVATVSNGKVTAKAAGTAVITLSDGTKQAQCVVTVKATATLTINTPKNTIVFVGETLKLDYTYDGTGKLTFSSWDPDILTIDSNGKMKGVSEGVVGIEVTDGKLYKFVDIVVRVKATSIKITNMEGPLFDGVTKYVGDYMSLVAKSRPTGTAYFVRASSSNSSVVSVSTKTINGDETKITLTYKAAGSATITLTSEDGNVVYKYKVNVKAEYSCYPGKEKLTPEEFAEACTQVMVANGFKASAECTSYRVLTLTPQQLTWTTAKGNAQGYVRSWYPGGDRYCWISYEGIDEKGNYIFYTRWG